MNLSRLVLTSLSGWTAGAALVDFYEGAVRPSTMLMLTLVVVGVLIRAAVAESSR